MHGSYLQGMETWYGGHRPVREICTDPTYKEWKPYLLSLRSRDFTCTDPTYKEWKLNQ